MDVPWNTLIVTAGINYFKNLNTSESYLVQVDLIIIEKNED